MSDIENVTLVAEVAPTTAEREITKAVGGRHKIARAYVARLRRRNPDATPAEVVTMLERHYVAAIAIAGGVMTAGSIAANIGMALVPGATAGKEVGKGAAKVGASKAAQTVAKRAAAKAAARQVARGAARTGADRAVLLLPAGEEQLQFEITAVFALALADLHGLAYDKQQAHTLVYALSNGRVSQEQIKQMAADLVDGTGVEPAVAKSIATGRKDWSHWADTLANALPGGQAQDLVRTIQTGQLETTRAGLSKGEQKSVDYGVGALVSGVTRFVFGREVVEASREAFPEPPAEFPSHLSDAGASRAEEDDAEANRAVSVLEDAAKATGGWVTATASKSTRPFRRVDLDGDGIPDEAQAFTALKRAGGAASGAVSSGTRRLRARGGRSDSRKADAKHDGARSDVSDGSTHGSETDAFNDETGEE